MKENHSKTDALGNFRSRTHNSGQQVGLSFLKLLRVRRRELQLSVIAVAGLALLIFSGCGGALATVEGVVTLDNQTLKQGTVTLHPTSQGQVAYGTIQADGRFVINTGEQMGLTPGSYTATVVSLAPPAASESHELPSPGEHLTPTRYASVATSDLNIEIRPGQNEVPLKLTSP